MVFPIVKLLTLGLKATAKPIASVLKSILRKWGFGADFMVWCGNKAHLMECKINLTVQNQKHALQGKPKEFLEVPEITRDVAFIKGVEYFVELLILYGMLGCISVYEVAKSVKASK